MNSQWGRKHPAEDISGKKRGINSWTHSWTDQVPWDLSTDEQKWLAISVNKDDCKDLLQWFKRERQECMERRGIHALKSFSSKLKKIVIFNVFEHLLFEIYKTSKVPSTVKGVLLLFKSHVIQSLNLSLKISIRRALVFGQKS